MLININKLNDNGFEVVEIDRNEGMIHIKPINGSTELYGEIVETISKYSISGLTVREVEDIADKVILDINKLALVKLIE